MKSGLFAALAAALAGCAMQSHTDSVGVDGTTIVTGSGALVEGSGAMRRDERAISGVHGVRFETMGTLLIEQGADERLTVEADDNLLPLLTSAVQGGTLVLGTTPGASFRTRSPIVYRLAVRSLDQLVLAGSGEAVASGLACETLRVELTGQGSARLAGTATRAEYLVKGAGTIDAGALAAGAVSAALSGAGSIVLDGHGDCAIDLGGSGTVSGRLDCERLTARLGGLGSITLAGRAADQVLSIGGSGDLHARDLLGRSAAVTISGLGSAEVHVDGTLEATVSGSGSVRYAGAPALTSRVTGLGSVGRL